MGGPYFKHRAELEALGAVIVSSNYSLYGDMSSRVMHTLGQFAPDLEIYSIDEAWLNLTGFSLATLDAYGREIVATTYKHTGIPVSMGIGPTKVLAKIANRICKQRKLPGQVFNIGSEQALEAVLADVDVGDIWGIGRRWEKSLKGQGIHTALDLRNAEPDVMRREYSVVMQRLVLELRGIPCLTREDISPKKQIIASRSFGKRVTDIDSLLEAVALHATRAGEKLRAQNSVCGALQVSIRTGKHDKEPYINHSGLIRFPVPTSDTRKLIKAASQGVKRLYQQGPRYNKAGVMLMDISSAQHIQQSLFDEGDSEKAQVLMQTIDSINREFGKHTLFFAREGIHKSWAMKRGRMTPAYTTRWSDVPSVR